MVALDEVIVVAWIVTVLGIRKLIKAIADHNVVEREERERCHRDRIVRNDVAERTVRHKADRSSRRSRARHCVVGESIPIRVTREKHSVPIGPGDDIVSYMCVIDAKKRDSRIASMYLVVLDLVARFARILGIDRDNTEIESGTVLADNTVSDNNALFARNRDCDGGH